jgi:hypothetical protein
MMADLKNKQYAAAAMISITVQIYSLFDACDDDAKLYIYDFIQRANENLKVQIKIETGEDA